MSTPRIDPLSAPLPAGIADRLRRLLPEGMPAPQIFLTVARNEGLFENLVDSGLLGPTGLLDRGALAPALRELVILRTCTASRNAYEFNLHEQAISQRMGLTPEQIDDLREPVLNEALWSPAQRAVALLVDALVQRLDLSDEEFKQARRHFDDATLIEITQLVGLYTGVAMLVALTRPRFDRYRQAAG